MLRRGNRIVQLRRSAAAVVLAGLVVAAPAVSASVPNRATYAGPSRGGSQGDWTFALIGDIPYEDEQVQNFPDVVRQIGEDPDVRLLTHLGDIKSGTAPCTDAYFARIRNTFDQAADPLVYTPGDNEWTDCHYLSAGNYNPLERLARIRSVFFPHPGRTLGVRTIRVHSQVQRGLPENVRFRRAGVSFAAVHVVGSENGLVPWSGNDATTPSQHAEVDQRTTADVRLIHQTFAVAAREGDRAVVLFTQADMFNPSVGDPAPGDWRGFRPIARAIAVEAARFDGPVYLFNGDSHTFHEDRPLASGSVWLELYGISAPVPNLTRITVDGSTDVDEWLKVTVHGGGGQVLTWERVPFAP